MWAPRTLWEEYACPLLFQDKEGTGACGLLVLLLLCWQELCVLRQGNRKREECLWKKKSYRPKEANLLLKFHWKSCFSKPLKHFNDKWSSPLGKPCCLLKQEQNVKGRWTTKMMYRRRWWRKEEARKHYSCREQKIQCWINPSGYHQEQEWHCGSRPVVWETNLWHSELGTKEIMHANWDQGGIGRENKKNKTKQNKKKNGTAAWGTGAWASGSEPCMWTWTHIHTTVTRKVWPKT